VSLRSLVTSFAAAWLAIAASVSGVDAQQQPPKPLPPNTELDALAAAKKWNELGAVLMPVGTAADLHRKLDWLKAQVDSGGGFYLTFVYARSLWEVGNMIKVTGPNDPRLTAGLMTLYAIELVMIDGAKCKDRTAPDNRLYQMRTQQAATLEYLRGQSPEMKSNIVAIALSMEKKMAPLRGDDDLICMGGLETYKVSAERGKMEEQPKAPGYVGRRIAATPPPDWKPELVGPEVYRPLQDKARSGMRDFLLKLVG
jgi:hypothetical protein